MAYRRYSRRSSYRSGYGRARFGARRGYGRRGTYRRRRRSTGRAAPRIVVQVVGGAGGVAASPVTLGMKASRPLRSRY